MSEGIEKSNPIFNFTQKISKNISVKRKKENNKEKN